MVFVPIGRDSRFNYNELGPLTSSVPYYSSITEILDNPKNKSAKNYKDRMASTKTEKRDASYYDDSAVNAYHNHVWMNTRGRKTLLDEYEDTENVVSNDVRSIIMNEKSTSKVDAMTLSNESSANEEQRVARANEIEKIYNFGLERTKSWGMQSWKPFRESSGSGGSGSTTSREPAISQTGLIPFTEFEYGGAVDVGETVNIREAGGFRAFDSVVKIKDTGGRNARSNIESADLNLRAFAMDSKYRLHVHLSVPQKVDVYKFNGSEYTSAEAVRAAKEAMYDTTPLPDPQERTIYQDQFLVLRPFNMVNADNEYAPNQWSITPEEEDDLYNNVLRKIGYYSLTAKGREETGQEGMARMGFKYLKDIYIR